MSSIASIDPQTADVIRSAMAAAQAGRLEEACEIGERGLANGGDPAALNAGSLQTRRNFARALVDAGRPAEAEIELRSMADNFPHDPTALADLFGLLQGQGWDKDAEEALKRAIERDPKNVGMLIALG